MAQASGSSAEIWYKIEQVNGVTPSDDSGASTTLASAVNPGATSISVASGTGIAAGEILRVGNTQNMEFVKVDSSYVSGTTVPLDTNTKINYRHESGEDVKETDPTGNWFKLGENDGVHLARPRRQRGAHLDAAVGPHRGSARVPG